MLKLYLAGNSPAISPWTADEIARTVDAAHARGAAVTAHATTLASTKAAVTGGVDAIEHGWILDTETCDVMARRGTFLVPTLAVFSSLLSFGQTTRLAPFATKRRLANIRAQQARAVESVRLAHAAGVRIAAGTDFGGPLRANHLAWEIAALVDAGLEPWQALGAATWLGGELLGEPQAGVITEGGPADFFLVHGDPLSDPESLWRVWRVAWAA